MFKFELCCKDVCVDGWALTLLSEENAGAAANCNAAGQSIGVFFGYGVFMALHSPEFCNKWLRSIPQGKTNASRGAIKHLFKESGMMSIEDAYYSIGMIFLVATVLIALFKTEVNAASQPKESLPT